MAQLSPPSGVQLPTLAGCTYWLRFKEQDLLTLQPSHLLLPPRSHQCSAAAPAAAQCSERQQPLPQQPTPRRCQRQPRGQAPASPMPHLLLSLHRPEGRAQTRPPPCQLAPREVAVPLRSGQQAVSLPPVWPARPGDWRRLLWRHLVMRLRQARQREAGWPCPQGTAMTAGCCRRSTKTVPALQPHLLQLALRRLRLPAWCEVWCYRCMQGASGSAHTCTEGEAGTPAAALHFAARRQEARTCMLVLPEKGRARARRRRA